MLSTSQLFLNGKKFPETSIKNITHQEERDLTENILRFIAGGLAGSYL